MTKPNKALLEEDLKLFASNSDSEKIVGSHAITKKWFDDNGTKIEGYFKKLDPENGYPEILAKFSVATSVLLRVFLGKRAAEERLVVDKNGKIVGTFSISLEGFKPFNFSTDPEPKDPTSREKAIPSTRTLIEHDVIALLFARWFLNDDDGHPHNLGLAGILDFDMFFDYFTAEIKGLRPLIPHNNKQINLTLRDWVHFPLLNENPPYHWPTYLYPGKKVLPGVIPAALYRSQLPKPYPEPKQFENLASSPEAREQLFAISLRTLLTFQPEVVRARLFEYLGDIPFDYTSIDNKSVDLRKKYENELFPNICNKTTNTMPFVDVFLQKFYQQHFDSLYRLFVFYAGTDDNLKGNEEDLTGVPLPSTCNALYNKPSFYQNIETWVKLQNNTLYKDTPNLQFDLGALKKRYHQVWRDAFAPGLKDLLHRSFNLTNEMLPVASSNELLKDASIGPGIAELKGKDTQDPSVTAAWELFGKMPELCKEKIDKLITVYKKGDIREALLSLVDFTNALNEAIATYYAIERENLTEADNKAFALKLTNLYNEHNVDIRASLGQTTPQAKSFNLISTHLKQLAEQVNFKLHLNNTDDLIKDAKAVTTTKPEVLPLHLDEVKKKFSENLFYWAKSLSAEKFEVYVRDIIKNHYANSYSINRKRDLAVLDYLKASSSERGDNRLACILGSSTVENVGALNSALIKHLAAKMPAIYQGPSVAAAIADKSFYDKPNIDAYTQYAVSLASNSKDFSHLANEQGKIEVFRTMYNWVDEIPADRFHKIISSVMVDYDKTKPKTMLFNMFGSVSRSDEVVGYFRKGVPQIKIPALIFINGNSDSTLSTKLFTRLINEIKEDIAHDPEKLKTPGYNLISQLNLGDNSEHKDKFLLSLTTLAEEITHRQATIKSTATKTAATSTTAAATM